MMPSAFESLSDPCLPDFWIDTYTAAPGAIAMTAAVMIFLVEFGSTRYLARIDRRVAQDSEVTSFDPASSDSIAKLENGHGAHKHEYNGVNDGDHFGHHHVIPPPPEGHLDRHTEATQKLGVAILEAGIIFHSVFIGLTLAISTGSDFISLFITIIFHRMSPFSNPNSNASETFEGLALGSRIATLAFKPKDWRPYIMAAAYAFTTPIGIAIGMGVRSSYDPNSQTALISAGVFDSVSAGLLIYAGMVELLAHDFIHGEMRTAPKGRVLLAIGSLLIGAALMALLGRWA
jgi:solute carrier family 39 (zinc transporter), member 1/2/3